MPEQPDMDARIGPHPFMSADPASDAAREIAHDWADRYCALWGCGRDLMHPIHESAPGGSRILELAKAVDRMVQDGLVMPLAGAPLNITFRLLHDALEQDKDRRRAGRCGECGGVWGEHETTCSIGGVMARYQAEGR